MTTFKNRFATCHSSICPVVLDLVDPSIRNMTGEHAGMRIRDFMDNTR